MGRTSFMYILVEERRRQDMKYVSNFHLIDSDEFLLLRCLMTLQLLPSNFFAMLPTNKPFTAAMMRIRELPQFRKILPTEVDPLYWQDMLQTPGLVIMTANLIPDWLPKLTAARPIALLTSSERTLQEAKSLGGVSVGLLKGFADIREFYRATGELLDRLKGFPELADQIPREMGAIDTSNLMGLRPRLDFIDYLPSPQPWAGRSAAILYNRLSNAAEEPSLLGLELDDGRIVAPALLNWCAGASRVMMAREQGLGIPKSAGLKPRDVNELARFLSSSAQAKEKFAKFIKIGRIVSGKGDIRRPFLTVPVPRLDTVKTPTEGMTPDLVTADQRRIAAKAAADFIRGEERKEFSAPDAEDVYVNSQHTILQEQRLLACQGTWLSSIDGRIPLQLRPFRDNVPNALNDFLNALDHDSKKSSDLFRVLELTLAASLPESIVDDLLKRASSVTLCSDYPFEWTLIEDRPLCLYRPTARIPLSMNSWYNLSAALTKPYRLTPQNPDKVLVLDLIEKGDTVRSYSDAFIRTSANIGNKFTLLNPKSAQEARELIRQLSPEIVVIDSHGRYDRAKDRVSILIEGKWHEFSDLLPQPPTPPVWIVSACETAQSEALRGCVVRSLLSRGAYAVVATLTRVDAFIASMLVGRLLADVYQPLSQTGERSLLDIFFNAQFTTALVYDPLLPLVRRAETHPSIGGKLGYMFGELVQWFNGRRVDPKTYHEEVATKLTELLVKHALYDVHRNLDEAGHVRPETLMFSIYGFPDLVTIAP
jgi:hypothetical protein